MDVRLRVVLRGVSPVVVRRLEVSAAVSLSDLNRAPLVCFGWPRDGLHQLRSVAAGSRIAHSSTRTTFADSENAYTQIFSDSAHRVQDLTGSVLLIASAVALGVFAEQLAPVRDATRPSSVVVRVGGTLAAASILVAGAALLPVPASLLLGDFYGDPGIVTAQPVLPHLGYILLVLGSVIPATALMVATTRLGELPTWLNWVTVIARHSSLSPPRR